MSTALTPPSSAAKLSTSLTHCLGPQNTKSHAALVEKFLQYAANVEMIRLKSSGRNALDFALAYYLGRAVLADPCGCFHIISKDTGYDPLIEHLRSKRISIHRHDNFTNLTLDARAKLGTQTPPIAVQKQKIGSKPKIQLSILDQQELRVLEHLRKATTTRPRNEKKFLSWLIAYLERFNKNCSPFREGLVGSGNAHDFT